MDECSKGSKTAGPGAGQRAKRKRGEGQVGTVGGGGQDGGEDEQQHGAAVAREVHGEDEQHGGAGDGAHGGGAGEEDEGVAAGAAAEDRSALVSDFLVRQVFMRVRALDEALDEAAHEAEWQRRWAGWMAQERAMPRARAPGVGREMLQELGVDVGVSREVPVPGGSTKWWMCSRSPRVWVCPDFLHAAEVERLRALAARRCTQRPEGWTGSDADGGRRTTVSGYLGVQRTGEAKVDDEESAMRKLVDARCAAVFGVPQVAVDMPHVQLQFTPGGEEDDADGAGTVHGAGLHIDSNHQQERRFATILIYLKTLPKGFGGETIFPCAHAEEHVRSCAHRLADAGFRSTSMACDISTSEEGAIEVHELEDASYSAVVLAQAANAGTGLRVRPVSGLGVLFFSAGLEGGVDGQSWHGGAGVRAGCGGKWTAQVFEELPAACGTPGDSEADAREGFAQFMQGQQGDWLR